MGVAVKGRGRRTTWIVVGVAAVAFVVAAIVLAPRVLDALAVPDRVEVRDLLTSTVPADLDFSRPAECFLKASDTIAPLAQTLLGKEARLVSRGASADLAPGYVFDFDYGYKGQTIRVYADGRVMIRLDKSEVRNKKALLGLLWSKFADRQPGNSIYYEIAADARLFDLTQAAYQAAGGRARP